MGERCNSQSENDYVRLFGWLLPVVNVLLGSSSWTGTLLAIAELVLNLRRRVQRHSIMAGLECKMRPQVAVCLARNTN